MSDTLADAPDQPVSMRWSSPGLDDLVDRLRAEGFPVGLSETLDAARLLRRLGEANAPLADRAGLRGRLRPVFCKSSADQQRFDRIFDAWADAPFEKEDENEPPVPNPTPAPAPAPNPSPPAPYWWLAIFSLLMVAGVWWWPTPRQIVAPPPEIPQKPSIPATPKPESPVVPALPQAAPTVEPKHDGYFPALRYTEVLRPVWAWGLLVAPLLGLLLLPISLPQRGLSRAPGGQVRLDGWPRATTARLAVARMLPAVVGRFDRHLRGPANELSHSARRPKVDVARSVRATLARLGVPTLRHQHTRLRPSYLILVDAPHNEDLAVLWAQRFHHEGIEARLYRLDRHDGDPAAWAAVSEQGRQRLPLEALPAPSYGQRLMFVGEGTGLLNAAGAWSDWARRARFHRWPDRALFTPKEPRYWGAHEEVLGEAETPSDPGFLVLPQDDNALAAWADLLVTGVLPQITLSEPQHYPPLLAADPQRFLEDTPPPPHELNRLIQELKTYLGENGYYWLSTCAVPPLINHHLTLLLGGEFLERSGAKKTSSLPFYVARNYRLLVRLPWLSRGNKMPDWLRLALLASLPERVQQEVRRAVEELLAPQKLNPHGNLPLAFDPPRRKGRGDAKPQAHAGDALYLGFMDGVSAHQLTLRMPGQWRDWVGILSTPGGRWRRLRAWLSALRARLWYRHGLPHQGPAPVRGLMAAGLVVFSSAILTTAGLVPLQQWSPPLRAGLFQEQVHAIGNRHQDAVTSVAFSPDGRRIVSGSTDNTLRLWDANTGKAIGAPLQGHGGLVNSVAFSPDGRRIVSGSTDNTLRLWDANIGKALGAPLQGHEGPVTSVAFSPDGRRIVSGSSDNTLRLWDVTTGEAINVSQQEHKGAVMSVAFSPDGRRIASGSFDKTLRLWDATTGQPIGVPQQEHKSYVMSVAFSPDGRRIVSGSWDNTLRLWDANPDQAIGPPLQGHNGWVASVALSPDGRRIVSGSWDKTLRLWDAKTGEAIGAPLRGHQREVTSVAFSPDGRRIVSGSWDDTLRLWDMNTDEAIGAPLQGHNSMVTSVAFSPDGRRIVSGSWDSTLRLWDAPTGQPIGAPLQGHESTVTSVAFSPDGRRIVSGSWDQTLRLWDANTGEAIGAPLQGHEDRVTRVAFSPDGRRIVSGSDDNTLRLWDANTGQLIGEPLQGHEGPVSSVAFSPDGRRIVSGSYDGTARLWDAASGTVLGPPIRHRARVNQAAFSPDGTRIITAVGGLIEYASPPLAANEPTVAPAANANAVPVSAKNAIKPLPKKPTHKIAAPNPPAAKSSSPKKNRLRPAFPPKAQPVATPVPDGQPAPVEAIPEKARPPEVPIEKAPPSNYPIQQQVPSEPPPPQNSVPRQKSSRGQQTSWLQSIFIPNAHADGPNTSANSNAEQPAAGGDTLINNVFPSEAKPDVHMGYLQIWRVPPLVTPTLDQSRGVSWGIDILNTVFNVLPLRGASRLGVIAVLLTGLVLILVLVFWFIGCRRIKHRLAACVG